MESKTSTGALTALPSDIRKRTEAATSFLPELSEASNKRTVVREALVETRRGELCTDKGRCLREFSFDAAMASFDYNTYRVSGL